MTTSPPGVGRRTGEQPLLEDIFEHLSPEFTAGDESPDHRTPRHVDRSSLRDRWRRPPSATEMEVRSPFGLILARPILLLLCALIGGGIGFGLGGGGSFQSSVVLQFTTQGADSTLVKQNGQTIAQTAITADVLKAAAATIGPAAAGLANRVSAQWETDTQLVSITVTSTDPTAAVSQANAVAQALVKISDASLQARLKEAHDESNEVLESDKLNSAAAEAARVAQLGSSLGSLQDSIASQSTALSITEPASTSTVAGFSKLMAAAVGVVAGLLLGGLISLLLGVRGLGVSSERALRRLVPTVDVRSTSQTAQIAGQFVEADQKCVAVIATPGARAQALRIAEEISFFVQAIGPTVMLKGPNELDDRGAAVALLRRDNRRDVRGRFGVDMLIVVVSVKSDAAALLQGQSDVGALVVMRRRRTPVAVALQAMSAFRRAEPVLVLAG